MKQNKILIADDHELTCNGIKIQLKNKMFNSDIRTVNNGSLALEIFKEFNPDILVTDINMPGLNGLELIKKVREINPETIIIVVTFLDKHSIFKQISKLNVNAVVLKTDSADAFGKAFEEISEGRQYISPRILSIFEQNDGDNPEKLGPNLTEREQEVLGLLADDLSTQEIAEKMMLAETTIETYRASLRTKFTSNTMQGVVSKAYKYGFL